MVNAALLSFVVAIISALFAFGGIGGPLAYFAQACFAVCISMFIITVIVAGVRDWPKQASRNQ